MTIMTQMSTRPSNFGWDITDCDNVTCKVEIPISTR